jgi:hypothetical protein
MYLHGVRLVSAIGGYTGGSGNLSINLSNVARLAAHPKFVRIFNVSYAYWNFSKLIIKK